MPNNFSGLPDITVFFKPLLWFIAVFGVLGTWKLVEIAIWLFKNVSITVGA